MYEDDILSILAAARRPLSIAEAREELMRRLGTYYPMRRRRGTC
jgi:hypothetical protein